MVKEGEMAQKGKKYRDKRFPPYHVVPEMKQMMDMPRSLRVLSPGPWVREMLNRVTIIRMMRAQRRNKALKFWR